MAWIKAQATDYKDCLEQLKDFCIKTTAAGAITPGGGNTGDGTVYGASATASSVAETWTLTCTTGGGNETAVFSVSGSVSGAQADATAGVPYSIAGVSFIIVSGDVDFVSSDSFTFSVAASTAEWVVDRWDTDYDGSGGYELIMHGTGGGSDAIYMGIRTLSNTTTYWNLENAFFTGYVSGNSFETQPGYTPRWCCANNASFEFYVAFTSYRVNYTLVPVEGSHEMGGAGWLNSYAAPSQWSYPAFVGGSASTASSTIGSTSGRGNFPTGTNLLILRGETVISSPTIIPYGDGSFSLWRSSFDGKMRLYPATPVDASNTVIAGELDGIFWPTPYIPSGGLLTALAVLTGTINDYGGSPKDVCGYSFRNVTTLSAGKISVMDFTGD